MITEAYIAGSIKKAIFKKDDQYFILEKSGKDNYYSFPINHINLSDFAFAKSEIVHFNNIKWETERLADELNSNAEKHDALNLFLMGMDKLLNDELRREVMELLLKSLFTKAEIETFVSNRIFSTKVPAEFDPVSASQIAEKIGDKSLTKLYRDLSYANKIIIAVRDAWKKTILTQKNQSDLNLDLLDKEFTDRGIFSDFVLALLSHNYNAIDTSIVKHADSLNEIRIDQPAIFLTTIRQLVYETLSVVHEKVDKTKLKEIEIINEDKNFEVDSGKDFIYRFNKLIDNFQGKSKRKRESKRGKRIKVILLSKFFKERNINDQVAWIKNKISEGNIKSAEKAILRLIEHQDLYSDADHLCKSLCDIAESFQEIHFIDISDLLAEKAANLNPKDSVPHCIIAENFRARGQLENALLKYDQTIEKFPEDAVPRNGKAETLRQMGKLQEALTLYDQTIEKFPKNLVVLCGKAETLREMGKLQEALTLYDQTIEKFPPNMVVLSGKAETLRQMGKLQEALALYDQTIEMFPKDVVARSGKAETLRQMGELQEALALYDQTIEMFPKDVVARSGKAETLRQMGELQEALALYDETIKKFPEDVFARNGKAETLRQMGKMKKALTVYDQTIKKFPENVVPLSGKAQNLRQIGKLEEALTVYDHTIKKFPENVVARNGKAETLRQMGKLQEALTLYEQTIEKFPENVFARNGKAETLRQMGKLSEADEMYATIIHDFSYNSIAKRARFVLLIQQDKNLNELEKQTQVLNPQSIDDWILNHIHCMLLIKLNKVDEAISKLKHGVENIKDIVSLNYYSNALSYAYIKKRNFKDAVVQSKKEVNIRPVFQVLVTHAYAASGNTTESKKYFDLIFKSEIKKIDEVSKYLSDRYHLANQNFFAGKSIEDLEKKIEDLEFDLLTESYLIAA